MNHQVALRHVHFYEHYDVWAQNHWNTPPTCAIEAHCNPQYQNRTRQLGRFDVIRLLVTNGAKVQFKSPERGYSSSSCCKRAVSLTNCYERCSASLQAILG